MSNNKPLSGTTAVVTGAGRGIGKAIAIGYAEAGASVCCAARTKEEIETTAEQINDNGGSALAVVTDVTDAGSVRKMVDRVIEELGGLDILVINAGGNLDRSRIEDSRVADWRGTIDLNLTGAYLCAQAVIPAMRQAGGGKIITIGSGLGHRGVPGGAAYSCAKAGLWMLTRILAQELWSDGISVNELIPGPVETGATSDATQKKRGVFGIESEWKKQPEDVVPLALFLATQPHVGPTAQSFSLMRRDT